MTSANSKRSRKAKPVQAPGTLAGMKAVILAGGKGTRLAPYTTIFPKPLMPIGDRPILEVVLSRLHAAGVRDIVISVGHLAELIRAFFKNGSRWGLHIEYAIEDKPLGTIGPLKFIENLGDTFFVLNGDVLTDLDFEAMVAAHHKSGALVTVATHHRTVNIDFGVLRYDHETRRIHGFEEKPRIHYDVSMGVYVLSKKCLDYVPKGEPFGFDQLMLALLAAKQPIHAYPHEGRWLDIGRPSDYERANLEYADLIDKMPLIERRSGGRKRPTKPETKL